MMGKWRKSKRWLSDGAVLNWFTGGKLPEPGEESPEIAENRNRFVLVGSPPKVDTAAPPPPPVEPTGPKPEPDLPKGPPPRVFRFIGHDVYERDQMGRWVLASDDGRKKETAEKRYFKAMNDMINFESKPEVGWENK